MEKGHTGRYVYCNNTIHMEEEYISSATCGVEPPQEAGGAAPSPLTVNKHDVSGSN